MTRDPDTDTDHDADTAANGDTDHDTGTDQDTGTDANGDADADGNRDLETLLAELHDHLRATEELPVEETATRWLGEAQAVAGDVVGGAPRTAVEKRVEQVDHLLSNVDETGDDEADRHVRRARELVAAIQDRLEGG